MSVAIIYKDQVVYLKGFGVRRAGKSEPVDPDTVFQLASMSKPIASTVVAALAGDGLVAWDDPIIRHDPSFAMHDAWVTRNVSLRDMFCHRGGLPDHAGDALEDIGYDPTRNNPTLYAGAASGGGRISAISRRMSANRFLVIATSAI